MQNNIKSSLTFLSKAVAYLSGARCSVPIKGSLLNDVLVPALSKFDRFIKNSCFHHGGTKCHGKYSVYCPAVSTQEKIVMILSPGVNILHFQTVPSFTD